MCVSPVWNCGDHLPTLAQKCQFQLHQIPGFENNHDKRDDIGLDASHSTAYIRGPWELSLLDSGIIETHARVREENCSPL